MSSNKTKKNRGAPSTSSYSSVIEDMNNMRRLAGIDAPEEKRDSDLRNKELIRKYLYDIRNRQQVFEESNRKKKENSKFTKLSKFIKNLFRSETHYL